MTCPICKEGVTKSGKTTVTIEQKGSLVFFKDVPALVCNNCGEVYLTSETSKRLYTLSNESFKKGSELEIIRLKKTA